MTVTLLGVFLFRKCLFVFHPIRLSSVLCLEDSPHPEATDSASSVPPAFQPLGLIFVSRGRAALWSCEGRPDTACITAGVPCGHGHKTHLFSKCQDPLMICLLRLKMAPVTLKL